MANDLLEMIYSGRAPALSIFFNAMAHVSKYE
jgi:hypothetical protein